MIGRSSPSLRCGESLELAKRFKDLNSDGDSAEESLKSEMNHHAEGILKGLGYVGIT